MALIIPIETSTLFSVWKGRFNQVLLSLGDLALLSTTDKSSLVAAITEVNDVVANAVTSFKATETESGESWLGDEVIYQRVYSIAALPNSAALVTVLNITGITKVLSANGSVDQGSNLVKMVPCAGIEVEADLTNLTITTDSDLSAQSAHVIIKYLK